MLAEVTILRHSPDAKVGLSFAAHPQGARIYEVFAGFAASRSQMKVGHVVCAVDGRPVDLTRPIPSAKELIAAAGTSVTLQLTPQMAPHC